KSECGDGKQIFDVAEFAGGVALEGQQRVVAEHTAAVVDNADQPASAGLDFDAQVGAAGIDGVFQQLLDDGSGAFDNFTRGDFVGNLIGKDADAAHETLTEPRPGGNRTTRIRPRLRFRPATPWGLA